MVQTGSPRRTMVSCPALPVQEGGSDLGLTLSSDAPYVTKITNREISNRASLCRRVGTRRRRPRSRHAEAQPCVHPLRRLGLRRCAGAQSRARLDPHAQSRPARRAGHDLHRCTQQFRRLHADALWPPHGPLQLAQPPPIRVAWRIFAAAHCRRPSHGAGVAAAAWLRRGGHREVAPRPRLATQNGRRLRRRHPWKQAGQRGDELR